MKNNTKINNTSISKKAAFVSVFGLAYYFFIAIILFKPDLISKITKAMLLDVNFYLIIVFSLGLSFAWFIMNIVLTRFLLLFDQAKKQTSEADVFFNAMFYSIGYLSLALLLNYILDYDFRHFVAYAYLFLSVRILWVFLKFTFKKM